MQIHSVDENEMGYSFVITNMLGQIVYEQNLLPQAKQYLENLSGLKGAYIYTIRRDKDVLKTDRILFGY